MGCDEEASKTVHRTASSSSVCCALIQAGLPHVNIGACQHGTAWPTTAMKFCSCNRLTATAQLGPSVKKVFSSV